MSRIQQILSKAERDGTLRPERDAAPGSRAAARVLAEPVAPREESLVAPPDHPFGAATPLDDPVIEPPPAPSRQSAKGQLHRLLVAARAPRSPAAEHYRSLRTRIAQTVNGRPLQVVLVTSPGRGDGKTVTAANLALTMAQEFHRRVLLVDADLRAPGAHELFGLDPGPGLTDVLTGGATLDDALIELPDHRLTILRGGEPSRWPSELLGSAQMRRLADTLRSEFDRVLIDTSPAHLADASVVAPLTDGILMVIRAGRTSRPAIENALGGLSTFTLLGLVLNESEPQEPGVYASQV